MSARKGNAAAAAALLLASSLAFGQEKAPASPPAKAGAEKAAPSKSGNAKAKGDAKDGDAKAEEEKPSGPTAGYSWSTKPAKGGKWRPKKKLDPNTPIATFPGFRMLADGSSQVWVNVTKKVSVTAAATSFVLVGAHVAVRNNTHALVTEYFDTPLARVKLKSDAAGAQLVLELRENVALKHRIVDGPAGSMLVYIDLPKAQKSYSQRDDFEPERPTGRRGGKVLPGKGGTGAPKRGPTQ